MEKSVKFGNAAPQQKTQLIEGRNAVAEAFRAGKAIDSLYILNGPDRHTLKEILDQAKRQGAAVNFADREELDKMSPDGKHQGVIAYAAVYEYAGIEDMLSLAKKRAEDPFLIILDHIEDPHNLGAIIRTANIAGAHGVIIPKKRAAGLTAVVAKASAGALNYTPVAKVANLANTIEELRKRGIWAVCADMDGECMYDLDLSGPIALVIGNEGKGAGRLVKEKCDFCAAIPQKGEIGSLNASVAAAVLSYEIVRRRLMHLK